MWWTLATHVIRNYRNNTAYAINNPSCAFNHPKRCHYWPQRTMVSSQRIYGFWYIAVIEDLASETNQVILVVLKILVICSGVSYYRCHICRMSWLKFWTGETNTGQDNSIPDWIWKSCWIVRKSDEISMPWFFDDSLIAYKKASAHSRTRAEF